MKIGRLLSGVAEDKKWRSKLELHRVFELWQAIVGPEIAAVAQPSLIHGHILWIKVTDSIWMQQLHLQKLLLLEKINKQLHDEKFSDIHLQLDSTLSPPPTPRFEKKTKTVSLDKKEEHEFDRLISSLKNEDLRKSLKSLWVKIKTKGK